MRPERIESSIFSEPSSTGEVLPAPAAPLPVIPPMPVGFIPPSPDEHLHPDAQRGADQITV